MDRIENKKIDKTKITITVLAVLLIISVSYIAIDKFQNMRINELQQVYQQGYSQGVRDTVISLMQQTENCVSTTITVGNLTREVIDITCLRISTES